MSKQARHLHSFAAFRRRAKYAVAALLVSAGALSAPQSASACEIWLHGSDGRAATVSPGELPEALAAATVRCGREALAVSIWTMRVDAEAPYLGVRDAALFRAEFTGPLSQIAEAEIPGAARISVLVRASAERMIRTEGARAHGFRRFVTFCDAVHQSFAPLNCSLHGARAKARATARDSDFDGDLDIVEHEISLYLGGDRLHVVAFSEPFRGAALAGASKWIDVLSGFRALSPGV